MALPVKNPVCIHNWQRSNARCAWICGGCGYELTDYELWGRHEGDTDANVRLPVQDVRSSAD